MHPALLSTLFWALLIMNQCTVITQSTEDSEHMKAHQECQSIRAVPEHIQITLRALEQCQSMLWCSEKSALLCAWPVFLMIGPLKHKSLGEKGGELLESGEGEQPNTKEASMFKD
jgi:hypothetical protein